MSINSLPFKLSTIGGRHKKFIGVCCTMNSTLGWSNAADNNFNLPMRLPFIIDVNQRCFEQLDFLLSDLCTGMDGTDDRPPTQTKECMIVATLRLLHLQLYAAICNGCSSSSIGLSEDGELVKSLSSKVVLLASNAYVINTIQEAAQDVLTVAWSLLLPTALQRAKALSDLLPLTLTQSNLHSGQEFMTNLLVESLMADNGLNAALESAIKKEKADVESKKEDDQEEKTIDKALSSEEVEIDQNSIPLLFLIRQLLRSIATQTKSQLKEVRANSPIRNQIMSSNSSSTSFKLFQQFHRMLSFEIYNCDSDKEILGFTSDVYF